MIRCKEIHENDAAINKSEKATSDQGMEPARIDINFEADEDDKSERVISSVQERFVGFFDLPERVKPFNAEGCSTVGDATGFPDVLDLSRYYSKDESEANTSGKSLFAIEWDRLRGACSAATPAGTTVVQDDVGKREEDAGGVDPAIANLEVMDDFSRLAMDAVQLDLASKCLKNVRSRQEQHLITLFESLSNADNVASFSMRHGSTETGLGAVLQLARSKIQSIKEIYLEEILAENGRPSVQFAEHIKSVLSGAWTFVPIRTVLDAIQSRRNERIQPADVEIVQLSLLWSVLVLNDRPTLFRSFSSPSDVYCRVAETYLMGPGVFGNSLVQKCVELMITSFLLMEGHKRHLLFRLDQPIAGLDAFKHFYEDLLDRFEEFSDRDDNFATVILIAAYMNVSVADSLAMKQMLWTTKRLIVRQITTSTDKAASLFSFLDAERDKWIEEVHQVETDHFNEYAKLLMLYVVAIRDDVVTPSRNPVVWAIAAGEICAFIRKHSASEELVRDTTTARSRDMLLLTNAIQTAVQGKLPL